MRVESHHSPSDWPALLRKVRSDRSPVTVAVVQAQPHWLTAELSVLREDIERALGELLLMSERSRVARVMLYDPPSEYISEFTQQSLSEGTAHRAMTEELCDWLRVAHLWSALFTSRCYMRQDRPEDERYQAKAWVLGHFADRHAAKAEASQIPTDCLLIARSECEPAELLVDGTAGIADGWRDRRLLWLNPPPNALNPILGREAREMAAAGITRFFTVDVVAQRWWGADQREAEMAAKQGR